VLWHYWLCSRKGIWSAKIWVLGCWHGLGRGVDLHMAQLMPLPLASVNPDWYLPFWYQLMWVVPNKGCCFPESGIVCSHFPGISKISTLFHLFLHGTHTSYHHDSCITKPVSIHCSIIMTRTGKKQESHATCNCCLANALDRPSSQFFRLSVCLCVCKQISSQTITSTMLRNVVASTPIVCETNRK